MILDYNGIPLNNPPSYIVETIDTSVTSRGSNVIIPYRVGRVWQRKELDERRIIVGLLVTGTSLTNLETNLDFLKKLFGARTQKLLRFTMGDGSIRQQYAEVPTLPSINYLSSVTARMAVELILAEPLLRSDTKITSTQTINESPKFYTIVNFGTAEEYALTITLTGPLNYPKIYNLTSGTFLGYLGNIESNKSVIISCKNFTATLDSNNVISLLVHSGSVYFMNLLPGNNEMKVEDNTHTTGIVKIEFYPPYL